MEAEILAAASLLVEGIMVKQYSSSFCPVMLVVWRTISKFKCDFGWTVQVPKPFSAG